MARARHGRPSRRSRRQDSRSRSPRDRRPRSRSNSSEGSVFRVASSIHSRSSQNRLRAWIAAHPGRAATRLLQGMEDVVGRDGEAGNWAPNHAPACAKACYYRVLRVNHSHAGIRNHRELLTLCTALDHLSMGRSLAAADLLAQRVKAVERAIMDGNWAAAQFLELIDSEAGGLVTKDESFLLAKELELQQKLQTGKAAAAATPTTCPGATARARKAMPAKARARTRAAARVARRERPRRPCLRGQRTIRPIPSERLRARARSTFRGAGRGTCPGPRTCLLCGSRHSWGVEGEPEKEP